MRRAVTAGRVMQLPAVAHNTQSGIGKSSHDKRKIRFVERTSIAAVDKDDGAARIGRMEDIEFAT